MNWYNVYTQALPLLPARTASNITTFGTFLVSLCAVIAQFLPAPEKKNFWYGIYTIINKVAMNSGYASNNKNT